MKADVYERAREALAHRLRIGCESAAELNERALKLVEQHAAVAETMPGANSARVCALLRRAREGASSPLDAAREFARLVVEMPTPSKPRLERASEDRC